MASLSEEVGGSKSETSGVLVVSSGRVVEASSGKEQWKKARAFDAPASQVKDSEECSQVHEYRVR
jgi:hypothetical protein